MKKKPKISALIIFIIAFIYIIGTVIYTVVDHTIISRRYTTPELAIQNDKEINPNKILKILTYRNYALAFYEYNSTTTYEYLENNSGWSVITNQLGHPVKSENVNGYSLDYHKYNNKNIIVIATDTVRAKNIINPSDSISSKFKLYSDYISLDNKGFTVYYWFLVLDDLPRDYQLNIDNKVVKID